MLTQRNIKKLICCMVTILFMHAYLFAQENNYWSVAGDKDVQALLNGKEIFPNSFKPVSYKLFRLNETGFRSLLMLAPHEQNISVSKSAYVVTVPVANGMTERFAIVQAPVMSKKLGEKYPAIKSFIGRGIDHPGSVLRGSISQLGFFATVISPDRPSFYINAVQGAAGLYSVNARDVNDESATKIQCATDAAISDLGLAENVTTPDGNVNDGTLRVFRLALCTTGEFSRFHLTGTEVTKEDSIASVLAGINVYLTRSNALYERDLSVRLQLVDDEDTLIFLDPVTDGFNGGFFGNLNSKCQKYCDERIGDAGYDVGHVVHKGGDNGNAGCIGCVCKSGEKGSGMTVYSNPSLVDYFVIDYWTHEMGHQFGANHTFTHSIENGSTAQIEPGSGSTIMGYAGITGATDVQSHTDDYFSTASLAQIAEYIQLPTGGGACAVPAVTGNTAPVAMGGSDYVLPRLTPFKLTGSGSDADGDALSYVWEQVDVFEKNQSNKYPKSTSPKGPVFRSILYSANPERVFPNLETILAGATANKWEALSDTARDINLRLIVRDNSVAGGNTASDNVLLTVTTEAGPFTVVYPNEAVSIGEGALETITWDVANTNAAPVNCANVNILLSIDGGITFPYVLASNTTNDGSEEVAIPFFESSVSTARVKIESVGNIFFDISDNDFSIDGALPLKWVSFTIEKNSSSSAMLKWSTANEYNNHHFDIERSSDGNNFTRIGTVQAGINKNQVQQYSYGDNRVPSGASYFRIKQVDADGKYSYSKQLKLVFDGKKQNWSASPNPANDYIKIRFSGAETKVRIEITSQSGKLMYTNVKELVNGGEELSVPVVNMANGLYYLKITTSAGTNTEKIVVSK